MKHLTLIVAGLCLAAVIAAAGDLFPHKSKTRRLCGLPEYDYRARRNSAPAEGLSYRATAVLREALPATDLDGTTTIRARQRAIRTFQLMTSRLAVDHCAVGKVAFTLMDDGTWIVNLRAEQTPNGLDPALVERTARFRRNRFFVSIRAYGAYELPENVEQAKLGRPELFRVSPAGFWVERKSVRNYRVTGNLPAHEARLFDAVDRVEVEFRYEGSARRVSE